MTLFNAPRPANIATPKAFFITPLNDDRKYRDRAFAVVRDVCALNGLQCERDVELKSSDAFTNTILGGLTWATLVICDLSNDRPNCYYELGIAQALGRPVCLIADMDAMIHADIQQFQVLRYTNLRELKRKLPGYVRDSAFQSLPPHAFQDQLLGKFGGKALVEDYLLSGWVVPQINGDSSKRWYECYLRVVSVNPARPLVGQVTFFLDDSFELSRRSVTARNGVALIEIGEIYGAFTVGATVHLGSRTRGPGDGVQLELNLMRVPGSNPSFRYM